jgi:hypothetical protein
MVLPKRASYQEQPPRARVTHSVAQGVPGTGAATALAFDTAIVNVRGVWVATANTRLTAPVPGAIEFAVSLEWAGGAGTYRSAGVRKNGATYVAFDQKAPVGGGVATRHAFSHWVELAAGDYLEVVVANDIGAGNLNVNSAADYTPIFEFYWKCPRA